MRPFLTVLLALPFLALAQIQTVNNETMPTARIKINSNFSWLTTNKQGILPAGTSSQFLRGSDKTFVAIDTSLVGELGNLYFTSARARAALSAASPISYDPVTGIFSCPTCGTGNIGTLHGLTVANQTFSKSDDTNVTLTLGVSGSDTHTFTLGWIGALAKVRQHAATVYLDGSYTDPAWLTLTAAGGRISGFSSLGHTHTGLYEPVLGNPGISGYVLSSTASGVRSWAPGGFGDVVKANNLSDLVSIPTARTNLGLGGAAVLNIGTAPGTVAAGDDSRMSGLKTCIADNDTQSATALGTAQISGGCEIVAASTIVEVDVWGGTGTVGGTVATTGIGSINIEKYTPSGGATVTLLSGQLATASGQACAKTATSVVCANGTTSSSSITVSTAALAAGDWVRISAATPDGIQTWFRVAIIYRVN